MRLIFVDRGTPACYAIRAMTASRWPHVAVEVDGWVYEARAATGVQRVGIVQAAQDAIDIGFAEVRCNDRLARAFLEAQVGKPYDWTAIWTWYGSRDWQEPDAWFCFELAAAAAAFAGRPLVSTGLARVTGRHLWLSPEIVRE